MGRARDTGGRRLWESASRAQAVTGSGSGTWWACVQELTRSAQPKPSSSEDPLRQPGERLEVVRAVRVSSTTMSAERAPSSMLARSSVPPLSGTRKASLLSLEKHRGHRSLSPGGRDLDLLVDVVKSRASETVALMVRQRSP